MKNVILLIILFLSSQVCKSQGLNNLWLFGYSNPLNLPYGGTTVDFQSGQLSFSSESRNINFSCTNALISDANGNLQFATNGVHIVNANKDTMLNGSGLSPCFYTNLYKDYGLVLPQAAIVIPFPSEPNKYYLFHMSSDDYSFTDCSMHLYYSVVDMVRDNGLGEVVQKNVQLLNDSLLPGRLSACKHANGRDWWLVCHKFNSNRYYKFLISPNGISAPFVQDIGVPRQVDRGQNCFSPDGTLFAHYEPIQGVLDIFSFDRCSGDFSPFAQIGFNDGANVGGVAISSNSKVLYVSSMLYVYQLDLSSSTTASDFDTVATYDWFYSPNPPLATTFFQSYLAPDGKIYIVCGNGTLDLHVINNPDSLGIAANINQHSIHLPTYNGFTVPNYPNYFLGPITGSICDSLISIAENEIQNSEISVYPNPVVGNSFTISYPTESKVTELHIYNLLGKLVFKKLISEWTSFQRIILPKYMESGVYNVLLVGDEINSSKFILNKF